MKDPYACTCDHKGCECLASIDMVVVAPSPPCQCGKVHQIAEISIFLYLCEPHAREAGHPTEVLELETMELVREAFAAQGLADVDFERAIWEYAPVPIEIAVRPN